MLPNYKLAFLFLLLCAPLAQAQYTNPPGGLDIYGGIINAPCTNTNTAMALVTIAGSKEVLCDALGHVFYMRSMATFARTNPATVDETGQSYSQFVIAKYGTSQAWANADIALFKTWGLNSLGPYLDTTVSFPWLSSSQVPFVAFADIALYSMYNPQHYVDSLNCLPKDLTFSLKQNARWLWGIPGGGIVDFPDPCWASYEAAYMANDVAFSVRSQSVAMKHYLIGAGDADSDNMHGFGSGPDFPANQGNTDFRLGYVSFFVAPVAYADTNRAQIYADGAVHEKLLWRNTLAAKYTNVAGLNAAWGSAYTTLDSSGTCIGPQPSGIACAVTNATPFTIATGDGVTLTFANSVFTLPVSICSMAIYVNGVLVGGDTCAGAFFGPNLSGSVNYATGAVNLIFAAGHAPAAGAAVTAAYIANGFGHGSGFMDEDCRAAHVSYCGNGSAVTAETLAGIPAVVQTDIGLHTKNIANSYSSAGRTNVTNWAAANGFVGKVLYFGPFVMGTWGVPPDANILKGVSGNLDFLIEGGSGGSFSHWTQPMLDFVNTNAPGMALVQTSYRSSNANSSFSWPGSACTHSGTTVNCTIAVPNKFNVSGFHIDSACNNADYNVANVNFTYVAPTLTYTKSPAPTNASALCNVNYDDANESGYASQAIRGANFLADESTAPAATYTASGIHPIIGYSQWAWQDYWNEGINWGFVDQRDNPYDGVSDVQAVVPCQVPNAGKNCGGEGSYHFTGGILNLGDYIDPVGQANVLIDNSFLGIAPPPPPAPSPNMFTGLFTQGLQFQGVMF